LLGRDERIGRGLVDDNAVDRDATVVDGQQARERAAASSSLRRSGPTRGSRRRRHGPRRRARTHRAPLLCARRSYRREPAVSQRHQHHE
jgi:hypothetical protein